MEEKPEVADMRKHTPGPWEWWTSNSWRRLRSICDGRGNIKDVLIPMVALADGHPDLAVSESDMALIASAPDLLAALEELVVFAEGERNIAFSSYASPDGSIPNVHDKEEIDNLDAMLAKAKAAIAMANGDPHG